MDNNSVRLENLLSVQRSNDDIIYDENSFGAAAAIASSKQMLTSALHSMEHTPGFHVKIADLGLGDGGHTFSTADTVVEVLGRKLAATKGGTAFVVFFSNLRLSDENRVTDSGKEYYVAGTSRSGIYWPLFPKGELDVVVTTNALQWLSQVPRKVRGKGSMTWNKGRVWIEGAEKEVVEAYAAQADNDLVTFLKYRKEDIVVGGMLFMLMAGRPSGLESQVTDDSPFKLIFTTLMDQAWQDLVDEGSMKEDRRDAFNVPLYLRNTEEVAAAIESCGGFKIEKMEILKIADPMNARQQEFMKDPDSYGRAMANLVQARQIKQKVELYLGPDLTSKFYKQYAIRPANTLTSINVAY